MGLLNRAEFEVVRPLQWQEVEKIWTDNEINQTHWQEFLKQHGFSSYHEWRQPFFDKISTAGKDWSLWKVLDPIRSVPEFRGGAFPGWKNEYYNGIILPKFYQMKPHPSSDEYLANFPKQTTIAVLNTEIGMIVMEGMHRCAAITKAAKTGKKLDTELYIAIARCSLMNLPRF